MSRARESHVWRSRPRRPPSEARLEVTTLGYGAMSLGARFGPTISQEQATSVLNAVLDGGVTFIDTEPDYGPSEEMIGAAIAGRGGRPGCCCWPDASFRLWSGLARDRRDLVLENIALRDQLEVLARARRRPVLYEADRGLWSALARIWPNWRSTS